MPPMLVLPRRDDAHDAIGAAALPFTLAAPSDVAIPLSPASPAMSAPGWLGALTLLASFVVAALLWQPQISTLDAWSERPIRVALVFAPAESEPDGPAPSAAPVSAPAAAVEPVAPRSPRQPLPAPPPPRVVAHLRNVPAHSPPPPVATAGSSLPAEEHAAAAAAPAPPSHVVAPPRPVAGAAGNPKPIYPPQAAQRGWQGTVLLHVTVSAAGRALAAVVLTSSGHGILDDQARQTVLNEWRFEPATEDGKPVTGDVNVPIQFRLAS